MKKIILTILQPKVLVMISLSELGLKIKNSKKTFLFVINQADQAKF